MFCNKTSLRRRIQKSSSCVMTTLTINYKYFCDRCLLNGRQFRTIFCDCFQMFRGRYRYLRYICGFNSGILSGIINIQQCIIGVRADFAFWKSTVFNNMTPLLNSLCAILMFLKALYFLLYYVLKSNHISAWHVYN